MERLTDGLKKILLAGIGTVAVTAEKSKEVLDEMVKRGELTVEQGKVLNQELKHFLVFLAGVCVVFGRFNVAIPKFFKKSHTTSSP